MRISKDTKSSQIIVDRIEGEYAVCETEDKKMIDLPLSLLPEGVKEGNMYFTPLNKEKEARKKMIEEKMNTIWVD